MTSRVGDLMPGGLLGTLSEKMENVVTDATHPLKQILLTLFIALGLWALCTRAEAGETRTTVLAGGCFWCVESDFEQVPGVIEAVSGFAGGTVVNPSYKQVVRGGTGHLEAVEITYDPAIISYQQLLHLFLRSVDVTDAGGQFCDRGHSYSTALFVSNSAEKATAEAELAEAAAALGQEVVTPVLPASPFYPADAYHQDYYKQNALVLTRFGPISKAKAYKRYRKACGRDARLQQLWGAAAAFVGN